ncbi:MAG: alginate export family protein [Kiritimatiellae bacterium]|nr:alginate export family protein [Kiritimatiellia bacterium]
MKRCMTLALAYLTGNLLFAGNVSNLNQDKSALDLSFGGDIRLRYDATNNMPNEKHGEKAHSDYMRLRTRLWGKAEMKQMELFLRVADEFRYYRSAEGDKGKQRFPDVLFIDNLYLKYSDLFDFVDVKIGRQEMSFGAKRIISDGTGGDGSRSNYFDAARLTFKFDNNRTLDAFGVYTARHDWLPTLGETHDAKSKGTKGYDYENTGYNQTEYGAGLYYTDKSNKEMPWEAYYVWKTEEGEHSKVIPKGQTDFQTHTFGLRLLPKFTETLSGETEVAVQFGDESSFATMVYGGLTYAPQIALKPKFTLGVQYMSGDKEGARGEDAWKPVFNRETGVGELVAPMFNKYAYNNFLYPHLKVDLTLSENQKLALQTGPMFAPVEESDGNGGHYGSFRGFYAQTKYSIALGKALDLPALKGFGMAFTGEVLTKGDYFAESQDGTAFFGRAEVTYKF